MSVFLLVGGVLLVVVADGGVWQEVGTAFIGGSVVGLVLTIAQHTLDQQAMKRQADNEMQLAVSASSDLQGIGLRGASLSKAYLRGKVLASANLDQAHLDGADLRDSNLTGASLRHADLNGADLRGAMLGGAVFDGADLANAQLEANDMHDARLVGATLVGAEITTDPATALPVSDRVDLSRARLDRAKLRDVRLAGVRASFASATGMDATAADLRRSDFSCADLSGAGLSRADLRGCDFGGADLSRAVLAGADLTGARLVGACMAHTDLTGALLGNADLRCADLRGAYLTNVELRSARLEGTWVLPGDLRRAVGSPSPDQVGAGVVEVEPAASRDEGTGNDGAASRARARVAGGWHRRRRRTRLRIVAGTRDLRPTARKVAKQMRERRRSLERINSDIDGIVVNDGPPHAGDPDELGLPDRVTTRRRFGRWRPRAELGRRGTAVEVRLRGIPGAPQVGVVTGTWDQGLASALQFALARDAPFLSWEELDAFSTWLERPGDVAPVDALEQVLMLNPRNGLALLLRTWLREVGDAEASLRALDEVQIIWGANDSGVRRALAAARLGLVQCQLIHRTSVADSTGLVARAQAAGDMSLALFDSMSGTRRRGSGGRRRRQRWLALRSKAQLARSLAAHIRTGDRRQPDHSELDDGIQRYRETVREFESAGLPVSPALRNNLAYCLMARVGRFMTGPGQGYSEAVSQLRLVLQQFGVYEQHCVPNASGDCTLCERPVRPPFGVYRQHCVGEVKERQGATSVQEMSRLSEAGEESGPDTHLRRRREVRLALANLGNLYRLFKRFEAALNCYGAALYCEPRYIEAYGERAWVRLEQADADGATQDIKRALDVPFGTNQQKARIVLYYVDALGRVGRTRDQGPWIERALQLDPASQEAKELADAWKAKFVEGEDGQDSEA